MIEQGKVSEVQNIQVDEKQLNFSKTTKSGASAH